MIEVHFAKSTAQNFLRAAKPCGKGANAEVCAVAGTLLAVRRISVLLSQKCGELSSIQVLYSFVVLEIAALAIFLFLERKMYYEKDSIHRRCNRHYYAL